VSKYLGRLQDNHNDVIDALIDNREIRNRLKYDLSLSIIDIFELCEKEFSREIRSKIITSGEAFLTQIFSNFLNYKGIPNVLLDAKDFMCVDRAENPNIENIRENLTKVIKNNKDSKLYITQGFICKNHRNQISNLKRGGSDYTATIIGAALDVEEIQIWTDIDGLHNNDPRYVSETHPISHITYSEAADLAFFGAKILHPKTVSPVKEKNIPIILKNTFNPEATGTTISNKIYKKGLKAISAKDDITVFKIKSKRKLVNFEYLKKTFDVFYNNQTPIDMMTTSDVAISLAIDNTKHIHSIVSELKVFSEVSVYNNFCIICVVGQSVLNDKNSFKIFDLLKHTDLRMISYGSSDNNISILVDIKDKISVLNFLNEKLFPLQYKIIRTSVNKKCLKPISI